jgi:hypothetical protein
MKQCMYSAFVKYLIKMGIEEVYVHQLFIDLKNACCSVRKEFLYISTEFLSP